MPHAIQTFEFPIYFLLDPPDRWLLSELQGDRAFVAAETRELAEDIYRARSPETPTVVGAILAVKDEGELLSRLRELQPYKIDHIGLKLKNGRVGKLHIPTLIAELESRDRGSSLN